jgi:hypothetical protein
MRLFKIKVGENSLNFILSPKLYETFAEFLIEEKRSGFIFGFGIIRATWKLYGG